jgi:hypothetical protein
MGSADDIADIRIVSSDAALGRLLRDQGIELVDLNSDKSWKQVVDAAIDLFAGTGDTFTADDIRELGLPEPHAPQAWGARFRYASRRGIVRHVGYAPSRRPTAHVRPVAVWCGATSRPAAETDGDCFLDRVAIDSGRNAAASNQGSNAQETVQRAMQPSSGHANAGTVD